MAFKRSNHGTMMIFQIVSCSGSENSALVRPTYHLSLQASGGDGVRRMPIDPISRVIFDSFDGTVNKFSLRSSDSPSNICLPAVRLC